MSFVVSLQGTRPTPRYDGEAWTSARIEEASLASGPWTAIEAFTLVPDPDPTRPAERDFTTDQATLAAGWYRVVFTNASGDQSAPTDPVYAGAPLGYRPSVAQVGNLLRARTVDRNNNELGTFTADTRPTDAQVEGLIDQATGAVAAVIGAEVPNLLRGQAADVVARRVAMLIELSYFPEQIPTGRSAYEQYRTLYADDLKALTVAVREAESGQEVGPSDDGRLASFAFPAPVPLFGDSRAPGTESPFAYRDLYRSGPLV